MEEKSFERKHMTEEEKKMMEEQEKTSEVWATEKEERMEKASEDIAGKGKTIVNPPSAGGKILKNAAGARCGYPSKKCD